MGKGNDAVLEINDQFSDKIIDILENIFKFLNNDK